MSKIYLSLVPDESVDFDFRVRLPKGKYKVGDKIQMEIVFLGNDCQKLIIYQKPDGTMARKRSDDQFVYLKQSHD